eukprot:Anaeramoba_flamelloidesc41869_g1_i1.p1 GENE.c41869_g1_i1~~c41869_g1_i1.p1  ORF type:complete len:485 (-),score=83.49 c41869_g1_i1:14-1444(-)
MSISQSDVEQALEELSSQETPLFSQVSYESGDETSDSEFIDKMPRSKSYVKLSQGVQGRSIRYGTQMGEPGKSELTFIQKRFERTMPGRLLHGLRNEDSKEKIKGDFFEAISFVKRGMQKIVADDFTAAFQEKKPKAWNFEWYLFVTWVLGVILRYAILLPIRILIFASGILLASLIASTTFIFRSNKIKAFLNKLAFKIFTEGCVLSWHASVAYHGNVPKNFRNTVIVANHTTMIDAVLMMRRQLVSIVGQHHGGLAGLVQDTILSPLEPIWFERGAQKDRKQTVRKIKNHLQTSNIPILLFPEGTCVNNEYCVMFKKGAFELDATIIPVAIRYNKIFVDAFWNSRKKSLPIYLLGVMASWGLVADIYFLDPMTKQENETPIQFAERVKNVIAKKAKLKNVSWDGYLKYIKLSDKFKDGRSQVLGAYLKRKFQVSKMKSNTANSEFDENPNSRLIKNRLGLSITSPNEFEKKKIK